VQNARQTAATTTNFDCGENEPKKTDELQKKKERATSMAAERKNIGKKTKQKSTKSEQLAHARKLEARNQNKRLLSI